MVNFFLYMIFYNYLLDIIYLALLQIRKARPGKGPGRTQKIADENLRFVSEAHHLRIGVCITAIYSIIEAIMSTPPH